MCDVLSSKILYLVLYYLIVSTCKRFGWSWDQGKREDEYGEVTSGNKIIYKYAIIGNIRQDGLYKIIIVCYLENINEGLFYI